MTRLAVITDVHADVHALRDALAQIDQFGVDQIMCCGAAVTLSTTALSLRGDPEALTRGNQSGEFSYNRRRDQCTLFTDHRSLDRTTPTSRVTPYDGIEVEVEFTRPTKRSMRDTHARIETVFSMEAIENAAAHKREITFDESPITETKNHIKAFDTSSYGTH